MEIQVKIFFSGKIPLMHLVSVDGEPFIDGSPGKFNPWPEGVEELASNWVKARYKYFYAEGE